MIKKSAYIRQFTPEQTKVLQEISEKEKIKNASDVLLFTLEQYPELKSEIARLNRIIIYKQNKIERLENP